MTAEKISKLHNKVAEKHKAAVGAAKYLKEKIARCTDKATKAILIDLQLEAEEKADKLGTLSTNLLNKYYNQKYGGLDNYIRSVAPDYYQKNLA